MPRITTLEPSGCPQLRALTFDSLGLIKVIESRSEGKEAPKVVERWGEPNSSNSVLIASIIDREIDPLIGVARKNNQIEILSPINGDIYVSIPSQTEVKPEDDPIIGLHLFKNQKSQSLSKSCSLLTCTTKGNASIISVEVPKKLDNITSNPSQTTFKVCGSGNILFAKVDEKEEHALFGGKGVEVNLWDINTCSKIWSAKSPSKNSLGIFTPPWFTCATFLSDDHRKFVTGTNNHEVRLYDISAQKRPIMSFEFRDSPIKAVTEDLDGNTIYIGNGSGDLASYDIRTGKLLGSFLGKCSGSIRSIARHSDHPVIASCGLDSYVRFWDVNSRQLLSSVYLKQHINCVVFDTHFAKEERVENEADIEIKGVNEIEESDEEEPERVLGKRKKKKGSGSKKSKSKKNRNDE